MSCVKKQREEIEEYSAKLDEMGGIFGRSTEALKKLKLSGPKWTRSSEIGGSWNRSCGRRPASENHWKI
ncbi:hypothetical protein FOZ62_019755 [Perkinsus olseni]|uniref:Uncharacterized protein n=1 Tax=Perkinsus olseni TaxID=32597 RepID=A0A7J6S179_PEROL|nr:hypothetical protein FOZ62_019755 [Perkinsus olseni]